MGALYLVRHGQASFGEADYDALSAVGRQQSEVLGRMLRQSGLRFDRILQGRMQRHKETAALAIAQFETPGSVEIAPWLDEFDHTAVLRGLHPDHADPLKVRALLKTHKEPAKAFHRLFEEAMERWMSGLHASDYPESYSQFQERCTRGWQELVRNVAPNANILAFTSGGPIARLMQDALGLADAAMLRLNGAIVNASISRLNFKADQLFVSYFNDHAHFGKTASTLLTYR